MHDPSLRVFRLPTTRDEQLTPERRVPRKSSGECPVFCMEFASFFVITGPPRRQQREAQRLHVKWYCFLAISMSVTDVACESRVIIATTPSTVFSLKGARTGRVDVLSYKCLGKRTKITIHITETSVSERRGERHWLNEGE